MMRYLWLALLFVPVAVCGQSITSVSGSVAHGSSLTIEGSGFGTKSPAAPLRYFDFEDGRLGQVIPDQDDGGFEIVGSDSTAYPSYSQGRQRLLGETCLIQDYSESANQTIGLRGIDVSTFYFSGWTYRDDYNETAMYCENVKFWGNFTALVDTGYAFPQNRLDTYWATNSGHLYCLDETGHTAAEVGTGPRPYLDHWFRLERYMEQGDPGVSNGNTWASYNLDRFAELNDEFYGSGDPYTYWLLGQYFRKQPYDDPDLPVPHVKVYWSEVYADTTQARVEIGDASTWSACTHREIQIPTAWSATEITVTGNWGTLDPDDDHWLYVVNRSGDVSAGYSVTLSNGTVAITGDRDGSNASLALSGVHGAVHYQINQAAQQTHYLAKADTVLVPFGTEAADVMAATASDTIRSIIDE